ncbi:hypothetical protein ACJX0J_013373, partial [Zea mays]
EKLISLLRDLFMYTLFSLLLKGITIIYNNLSNMSYLEYLYDERMINLFTCLSFLVPWHNLKVYNVAHLTICLCHNLGLVREVLGLLFMIYEIFYLPYIIITSCYQPCKKGLLAYMYIWLVQANTNHLLVGRMMTKNHLYHHPCITKIVIFINI